ncbi:ATP-dependent DNA ligase [Algoriphagus vanfongensis]|uniref:ATP-dependent DNA ligase n=1 Tax=Algoriphagus vanfongensis TaxID=426371 RepID=UPI00040123AC|nr:ATP-dependent DNA ligase [Algoriphagus vanfongensis]
MKFFASLVDRLMATTKTNEKIGALEEYFHNASDRDKVWVIALFTGRRPKRTISSTLLRVWCAEYCQLPLWLVEECYHTVGDLSETIALLIDAYYTPDTHPADHSLTHYIEAFHQVEKATEAERKQVMLQGWKELQTVTERFIFNKLLSGSFRIGVSQQLMVKALAKVTQLEPAVIAHRISGKWDPGKITFDELLNDAGSLADDSRPYPFYLAYPLEAEPESLGSIEDWQAEWKWDGIRGQLIKRNNEFFVWSRGEELMTDKFPEYDPICKLLPDGTVLDGEIIVANGNEPLPFSLMQKRIGRKNLSNKIMQEAPVSFFAYDLLELNFEDYRSRPLAERRLALEQVVKLVNHEKLQLSSVVTCATWQELRELREESRQHYAEGFMLKRKDSVYQTGRKRGDWWKWKLDPMTIDCVMIYAQKGSGRRSNLYTDYTFAVRDGDSLVPFAKAYSGLTDKEFAQVDAFVKRNAIEKFGPVRTVKPDLVFELAFEGIAESNRHKSGVAVRFPRIKRWRHDKKPDEINTLDDLRQLLELYGTN